MKTDIIDEMQKLDIERSYDIKLSIAGRMSSFPLHFVCLITLAVMYYPESRMNKKYNIEILIYIIKIDSD